MGAIYRIIRFERDCKTVVPFTPAEIQTIGNHFPQFRFLENATTRETADGHVEPMHHAIFFKGEDECWDLLCLVEPKTWDLLLKSSSHHATGHPLNLHLLCDFLNAFLLFEDGWIDYYPKLGEMKELKRSELQRAPLSPKMNELGILKDEIEYYTFTEISIEELQEVIGHYEFDILRAVRAIAERGGGREVRRIVNVIKFDKSNSAKLK